MAFHLWGNLADVLPNVKIKTMAHSYVCAYFLSEDGKVFSCGQNNYGQLGRAVASGSAGFSNLGLVTGLPSKIVSLFAFGNSAYFLVSNGDVWSCGYNDWGELGRMVSNGSETTINLGKIEGLPADVVSVTAASSMAYFLTSNGDVWSCGFNDYGGLGRAVASGSQTVFNLGRISNLAVGVKSVISGNGHVFFLYPNGDVYSCGYNNYGQLCRTVSSGSVSVVNLGKITGLPSGIAHIATGNYGANFLNSNGDVWNGGYNEYGQLGRVVADGSPTVSNLAKLDSLPSGIVSVQIENYISYFMGENNEIWNCGNNGGGTLGRVVGYGSRVQSNLGQMTVCPDVVTTVILHSGYALFMAPDGRVWNCGYNVYGGLGRVALTGTPDNNNFSQLTGLPGKVTFLGGNNHNANFRTSKGQVLNFGQNDYGQLGRSVPAGSETTANRGIVDFKTAA
jgi:alpha-tubulin suppressor-like RCC1 family protein